jgi:hypothetical protein
MPCGRHSHLLTSRPLRACRELQSHPARRKLLAATPTAFHPRPPWAPDEIKCWGLLKLLNEPNSDTATALRDTITTDRQNRAVVLLKVNILAAAQTDRHVSGASRVTGVIEEPVFGRGILQLFHFTAGLERKPHFPRAGVPQDQSSELRGVCFVRAIWRARLSTAAGPVTRERFSDPLRCL